MIFYGDEDAALAELRRKAATDVEPALTSGDLESILLQSKRADIYGRWPGDEAWQPTWEMDWACAEAWDAKAAKASEYSGSDEARITANCQQMAEKHRERIFSSAPIVKRGLPYQRLIV